MQRKLFRWGLFWRSSTAETFVALACEDWTLKKQKRLNSIFWRIGNKKILLLSWHHTWCVCVCVCVCVCTDWPPRSAHSPVFVPLYCPETVTGRHVHVCLCFLLDNTRGSSCCCESRDDRMTCSAHAHTHTNTHDFRSKIFFYLPIS